MSRRKTPTEVRCEAAEICDNWAEERFSCGDPEGAGVLQEAALEIRKIALTGAAVTPSKRPIIARPR